MNVHKNARLTPSGRVLMVQRIERGWSVARAARQAGRRQDRGIAGCIGIAVATGSWLIAVRSQIMKCTL